MIPGLDALTDVLHPQADNTVFDSDTHLDLIPVENLAPSAGMITSSGIGAGTSSRSGTAPING